MIRYIPLVRRPFFQRDRAMAERDALRLELHAKQDRMVPMELPDGTRYELSVSATGQDIYHDNVAGSIAAYDSSWHFLNSRLKPGDVFFDLGANIGTFSIPAAVRSVTVHAFELLDANVQHIVRSIRANKLSNVSIVLGAVSDSADVVGFGGYSAWGTTLSEATVSIPGVVIDDYVRQKQIRTVDVMKIDVEGSEDRALRGAAGVIQRDHPDIVIECNAVTCGHHGYSYRDLLRFLASHGYRLYRLFQHRLCPCTPETVQEVVFADYLATVKDMPGSPMTDEEIVQNIMLQDLDAGRSQAIRLGDPIGTCPR